MAAACFWTSIEHLPLPLQSHLLQVLTKGEVVRREGKNVLVDEADIGRRLAGLLEDRHARLKKDKPFFEPIVEGIHKYFQVWERETDVPDPKLHRYNQI